MHARACDVYKIYKCVYNVNLNLQILVQHEDTMAIHYNCDDK